MIGYRQKRSPWRVAGRRLRDLRQPLRAAVAGTTISPSTKGVIAWSSSVNGRGPRSRRAAGVAPSLQLAAKYLPNMGFVHALRAPGGHGRLAPSGCPPPWFDAKAAGYTGPLGTGRVRASPLSDATRANATSLSARRGSSGCSARASCVVSVTPATPPEVAPALLPVGDPVLYISVAVGFAIAYPFALLGEPLHDRPRQGACPCARASLIRCRPPRTRRACCWFPPSPSSPSQRPCGNSASGSPQSRDRPSVPPAARRGRGSDRLGNGERPAVSPGAAP